MVAAYLMVAHFEYPAKASQLVIQYQLPKTQEVFNCRFHFLKLNYKP